MSLLAWIGLGLIAGFVASQIAHRMGQGVALDILLGIVGAVIGGGIFTFLGQRGVSGFNPYSLVVAVVGAILSLVSYHLATRFAR